MIPPRRRTEPEMTDQNHPNAPSQPLRTQRLGERQRSTAGTVWTCALMCCLAFGLSPSRTTAETPNARRHTPIASPSSKTPPNVSAKKSVSTKAGVRSGPKKTHRSKNDAKKPTQRTAEKTKKEASSRGARGKKTGPRPKGTKSTQASRDKVGKAAFQAHQCALCHTVAARGMGKDRGPGSPPDLSSVGARHSAKSLRAWLGGTPNARGKKHPFPFHGTDSQRSVLITWLLTLR